MEETYIYNNTGNNDTVSCNIQTFKHYDILEEIASGGMGHVYRAYDTKLERIVVIKILKLCFVKNKEIMAKFIEEAKITAKLRHQNIAIIYEVGVEEDIHFIVMDYIEGETLQEYMKKKLSLQKRLSVLKKILLALDYAHKHSIIHCDLKPSNIIIDKVQKIPVILDFGIAKNLLKTSNDEEATMGTLGYMAPEQIDRNCGDISPRTDIYAVGCILYKWITGKETITGSNSINMIHNILSIPVTLPLEYNKSLPLQVQNICMKAIDKNPQKRYSSAVLFAKDIDSFLQNKKPGSKLFLKLYLGLPVLFLLITGIIYLYSQEVPKKVSDDSNQAQIEPVENPIVATQNNKKQAELLFSEGEKKHKQGQLKEAIIDYTEALRLDSENSMIYNARGFAYYNLLMIPKAMEDMNQAILCDSENTLAYNNRGLIFLYIKNFDAAILDFSISLKKNSQNAVSLSNRGLCYFYKNNIFEAITDYNDAIRIAPNFIDARINRGYAYFSIRKYEEALTDYSQAININPNNSTAYTNRGEVFMALGRLAEAIIDYSKAIELLPGKASNYLYRGFLYLQVGKNDEAILDFSIVIDLEPSHPTAHNNKALAYYNKGLYQEAIDNYSQSLKVNPNLVETYFNRGVAFDKVRDYFSAANDFQKCIEMQPQGNLAQQAYSFLQKYNEK